VTTTDWFRERYHRMLEHACGGAVTADALRAPHGLCLPGDDARTPIRPPPAFRSARRSTTGPSPTCRRGGIPLSYIIVIGMLVIASVTWLRRNGIGKVDVTPINAHMFFLGSASC